MIALSPLTHTHVIKSFDPVQKTFSKDFFMSICYGTSLIWNTAMASYLIFLLLLFFLMKSSHLSQSYLFKNHWHKYDYATLTSLQLFPIFIKMSSGDWFVPLVFFSLPALVFCFTPLSLLFVCSQQCSPQISRTSPFPSCLGLLHIVLSFLSLSLYPSLPSLACCLPPASVSS